MNENLVLSVLSYATNFKHKNEKQIKKSNIKCINFKLKTRIIMIKEWEF